ncbi:transporter [Salinibacterium sp. ZJ454]|uniref:thiolase C-terminal domain-containing protein n=1 Tax=Salinibacterium sp. ZJ454 TaxID=2708339 RepID=UPI001420B992|nr:transporter [Salinibacterium sp. ZJ454]
MTGVYVVGAAALPWTRDPARSSLEMAVDVFTDSLADAGLSLGSVGAVVSASSRFEGGLGWGLHANELLQNVGETGAAAVNVSGGCAAGGIAVGTAASMISSGQYDVVVAVGAERMPAGFISRPPGAVDALSDTDYLRWAAVGMTNPAYWALEARRRMHLFGTTDEHYAAAVQLMRRNGITNARARFRSEPSASEVLESKVVSDPLRLLQICAVSDGAAALVLVSERVARRVGKPLIEVAGWAIATGQFGDSSVRIPTISQNVVEHAPATSEVRGAVDRALEMAGVQRTQVDVLEFADNSAWHVLAWPEHLGYLSPGEGDTMVERGRLGTDETVFNPSGGFMSFGEATTAQGVLQVCELVWQLRGEAGDRQIDSATIGQTAVLGLGANGASVVVRRGA